MTARGPHGYPTLSKSMRSCLLHFVLEFSLHAFRLLEFAFLQWFALFVNSLSEISID